MAQSRLEELNALSEDPALWDNPDKAQKIMKERTTLDDQISAVNTSAQTLEDALDMAQMAEDEGDEALVADIQAELQALETKVQRQQIEALLSGEADSNDSYLQINAGAGGTEAQDWADMVLRMYLRWCDQKGYKTSILERSDGEEAGIKSITLKVTGHQAYGWLKSENGVHRLVRISPFDSNAKRHTSFASVSVSPVIDDTIDIEVEDKDIRVDTYRSSGAGGQHVNTTDSAVRMTHIPTGIVAACQSERSQHQNRAHCLSMLKAKLYEREMQEREAKAASEHGEKTDIGWGHQIRSYVLHPYQMIKDLRTSVETSDTGGVLDGDLDRFLEAALAQKMTNNSV